MRDSETIDEARREMEICNACRYCEGFCAVFPAMAARRNFSNGDLSYLANLCHGCNGCFYACQYAPPHEFAIAVPAVFAELRLASYAEYAWPQPLAALFRRNGLIVSLTMAFAIALVLLATAFLQSPDRWTQASVGPGAFYAVIPWGIMAGVSGAAFLYSLLALGIGCRRFWRDAGGDNTITARGIGAALRDVATLRNLGGGAEKGGCNDRSEAFSLARRRFHHSMFYGFLLCFASTVTATLYDHFLQQPAPYDFLSLPVILGTLGGCGMVVGCAGLLRLKLTADPAPTSSKVLGADYALLVLLLLIAATGLLLLLLRATGAMPVILAVHLGLVLSLFLAMPYSKFVHGIYRSAALLRYAIERRLPQS
jgi:citrate/tricarballylate utilization protein